MNRPAPVLPAIATPAPEPGRRVWPAEVMRVLTFAAVIAVHAVAVGNASDSVGAGAALMVLHVTREAFFVLTAFVLVHRWHGSHLPVGPFLRRRFLLIGVPYLVWSLVYAGVFVTGPLGTRVHGIGLAVLTGTAEYHLYFLLVSLQFALLLPLVRRLIDATRGHHGLLLGVSAALQLVIVAGLHLAPGVSGWAGELAPTYQLWFVAGGLLAVHRDAVRRALAGRGALVAVTVLTTALLGEGVYAAAVRRGTPPAVAADVFQPVVVLVSAAAVVGMWALGEAWAARSDPRPTGRWAAVVRYGSDRSFGVFLAHPLLMYLATVVASSALLRDLPGPGVTAVLYGVGALGSLLLVELVRRTPVSLALTGRPRTRRTPSL